MAVARRGSAALYELPSGRELKRLDLGPEVYSLVFHPDGRKLAVSRRRTPGLWIYDLDSGQKPRALPIKEVPAWFSWHPDGRRLAIGSGFHIYLWDAVAERQLKVLEGSQSVVTQVFFSHHGRLLVSTGWDDRLRLWDADTGALLVSERASNGCVLSFSLDDRLLASTREGTEVALWEVAGEQECRLFHDRLPVTGQGHYGVDVHPAGRVLASASDDGLRLYDAVVGQITQLSTEPERSVFFLPDGSLVNRTFSGLYRRTIRAVPGRPDAIQVSPAEQLLKVSIMGEGSPPEAAPSPDGTHIAVADPGRSRVLVLNVKDRTVREVRDQPESWRVALSAEGRWLAVGTSWAAAHREVRVVDLHTGKTTCAWPTPFPIPAFSPDGRWLVFGGETCQVREVGTWRLERSLGSTPELGSTEMAAFSSDGRMLAISYSSRVVRLVEVDSGRELARLSVPLEPIVGRISFSRDGRLLALGCAPHVVQLWDLHRVRRRLAEMGLDWGPAPPPAMEAEDRRPALQVVDPTRE